MEAHLTASRPAVIAALLRRFRDLETAEEGYQMAVVRALQAWPETGVPRNAEGWLVRVGHNALLDQYRKDRRLTEMDSTGPVPNTNGEDIEGAFDAASFQDDVLRLQFLCCHPQLTDLDQITLALRYVVGLAVPDMAQAFLVTPDTLQRRISRARDRAGRLGSPDGGALSAKQRADQIGQVRIVLYLMFNRGYAASQNQPHIQPLFCREAIRLTRLLLRLFPNEPETMGLLSLMIGHTARFPARADASGTLVSLEAQDRKLWDQSAISEARFLAQKALLNRRVGPFQLQAAICDVHNSATCATDTNWPEILRLYDALTKMQPTPVILLARLVALSQVVGATEALTQMAQLSEQLSDYLPYHAVLAGLSEAVGNTDNALDALRRALECGPSKEEENHLRCEIARLEKNTDGLSE
ncbi:RNA polymerase sigma factor [Roseibium sediminicola]|uniref:RNA polymerase sigma factor n=1 Tax=Roseibium sediminicola TaxID=2933272 RepID=A0ABT0GZR9_9HYPH|nr:DUF6596 domain-containing protein [Roseibium sp. CAU 1639]MCK7614934.1 RNA polymerase sigma factor [Roseibium sp. CAU 1639]